GLISDNPGNANQALATSETVNQHRAVDKPVNTSKDKSFQKAQEEVEQAFACTMEIIKEAAMQFRKTSDKIFEASEYADFQYELARTKVALFNEAQLTTHTYFELEEISDGDSTKWTKHQWVSNLTNLYKHIIA
ncbi:hypothetical protein A2U01_0012406, partial [Trifolium medium]|nr:hypothetical protein [Trifolium medium]